MAVFHAGAWWAARLSRVIAVITVGVSDLLLRGVDAGGSLDLEFVWKLRQKEAVRDVERELADRIEHPLEEGTLLFQRVLERCLSLSKRILSTSTD
jgi:hypothetical protein